MDLDVTKLEQLSRDQRKEVMRELRESGKKNDNNNTGTPSEKPSDEDPDAPDDNEEDAPQ